MTRKGSWNMNIDFNKAYSELQERATDKNESINARVKYNILLIALRNGCRNHEAIEAYNRFIASGKPEFTVRTEKRKNKQYMRPAVIPPEIDRSLPLYTKSDENLSMFCMKYLNFNPHSLRYSFITWNSSRKNPKRMEAPVIAKITGHTNLKMLIDYIQEQEAKRALAEDVIASRPRTEE